MKHLMYVIGEPGVGKSTLVEFLTRSIPFETSEVPIPFRRYECGVVEIGKRRREFSGTDALGMSIQPAVEDFLAGIGPKLVLAEGDRLGNLKFFHRAADLEYTIHVVALYGPEVARIQRGLRGSDQDPAWLKGRQSKVRRLMDANIANATVQVLPAGQKLANLESGIDNPVMDALRKAREGVTDAVH